MLTKTALEMSNCKHSRVTSRPLFLLVFLLFPNFEVCSGTSGYQMQKFAIEPSNRTAKLGSKMAFPCRVEYKSGQLQWTKDDFGLGVHRDLNGYDRYRMIGSDDEGDYTLEIRDVTLDDEGRYQCQVSVGARGEPAIRSQYAQLSVLVAPEPPKILQGSFYSTTEDRNITLECVSFGGKPASEIKWLNRNVELNEGVKIHKELLPDGMRFIIRSTMEIVAKPEHNNQTFTCDTMNAADRAPRVANIQIEVKYAPKVKIIIKSGLKQVPEGSDITVVCQAEANPKNMTFKWYKDGHLIVNSSELIIYNITREYNKTPLKCEVLNDVGKSEKSRTLEVTYPPEFRSHPNDIDAEVGNSVTLSCDVDSYPAPKITWLHQEEDQNILVGKTANLTLTVDTHTAGKYICTATVPGYPEIETSGSIFIKGPPKILSNSTQFGPKGDSVQIECVVFSVPRIDSIVWTFHGKEIDTIHDQDYACLEDLQAGRVFNSTLIIRESQAKHFGTYHCKVSNEYGSDDKDIILKPYITFPLLPGVTGMILVALLTILVIFCLRKQRKNQTKQFSEAPDVTVTEEELYRENDRNSNISDLKLRQANSSFEVHYPNTGLDSTLWSNAKLGSGIPLAGTVPLNSTQRNIYQPYRYSNDYTDPAYADCHKVNNHPIGVHYAYTPGFHRIQLPTLSSDKLTPNRSVNGSLPRSVDTASTVQFNPSQNNSFQRMRQDSSSVLNNFGLPTTELSPVPIGGVIQDGDRFPATYGHPHLRSGEGLGFIAKPAAPPAPPPYSSDRSGVLLSGASSNSLTFPTSLASPQCATSTSTMSTDSTQPETGVTTSSATSQSPSHYYVRSSSNKTISNACVTKKGNFQILQSLQESFV